MSTQSSFSRFSAILNHDQTSSSGNLNLSPDMAYSSSANKNTFKSLSSDAIRHQQQQRPVSEILKHESFISPETEALDKWFNDLQQYESSLESMANASLDPKYKEEVQHVDQWFRYLNEAERTATIYTLLQHSTQVQIRFFIAVLQQMGIKDPLAALLSPHPEKVDMQNQLAGAMKKAELEASQKLLSVLPYQTGQVISRPNANNIGRRNHIDRHSFALGDTEEYNRLFSSRGMPPPATNDFLSPRNSFGLLDDGGLMPQQRLQHRGMFDHNTPTSSSSRPKSVIEVGGGSSSGDLSSIFNNDWSYGGLVGHQSRPNSGISAAAPSRPKSADISNWSFGTSVSSKSVRGGNDNNSPWSGLSPTVATFGEQQQQQEQQEDQQLAMMANNWHLNGGSSNRSSVILSDDTKGFRRRAGLNSNRTSVICTVPETDERLPVKNSMQSPPPPVPATLHSSSANIVLSMYDDANTTSLFGGGSNSNANNNKYLMQQQRPTSPVPSQTKSKTVLFNTNINSRSPPKSPHYGQFLNPTDRVVDENGYYSDHSDTSARSGGSSAAKALKKKFGAGNNSIFPVVNRNNSVIVNSSSSKEKKNNNVDIMDMQLLEDIPAWLRSLRLHKYNPIFETMKWQDMLKMDDEALLGKGVAALGARRKLLKVFDQIKAHCQVNNITF